MKAEGWKGEAIDVVRMSDGNLTTIDNTRVLAARYAGIDAQVNLRDFDEPIASPIRQESLTTPKHGMPFTWGEAVTFRIWKQNAKYRNQWPNGSPVTRWLGN